MVEQNRSVLIYRAAGLVQAACDIDNQNRKCGSVRAGRILAQVADKLRDSAVDLRKQADALSRADRSGGAA